MPILTAPTSEPITLDEAKFAARLTGSTAFDAMLPLYIQAAREIAEAETGVRWMAQRVREEFTEWPAPTQVIRLAGPTAVAISYCSQAGAWTSLPSGQFFWADASPGLLIAPPVGGQFPMLGDIAVGPRVRVDVDVGAADRASVPAAVKTFIMAMVAYWVEHPQAFTDRPHVASPAIARQLDTVREAF